ncbi:unnamed protein product [Rhizoctonia solani]|uniref:Protein kinase domain-containing protein n=1 Tax=Rhizoctonia solani TaxID=456999 RepID=A0A8H2WZB8_9AGAM|nr:unnamed protein product [Rhizoctonia solani]
MLNDFGNARVQNSSLQFSRTTTGVKYTMRWAAPELLTDATAHTREADVYALGMTILEVFTGDIPYSNVKNNFAVMHHVVSKKEFPTRPTDSLPRDSFGDEIWEALTACWSYEPIDRPHAADVEKVMGSVYLCKLAIPRVHVLIIGVNEYENGPQRIGDARSMLQYFTSLGVPSSHLVCLLGRQATEEGIMNAVKSHLIDNPLIEPDDPVVVYFAG